MIFPRLNSHKILHSSC